MILTGEQIRHEAAVGGLRIEPFRASQVTTNSYDLTLGYRYIKYADQVLDPRVEPVYEECDIPPEGLLMNPGDFILAETEEMIGGDQYVPIIHGKSSTARSGLFVHITADLIDIGSFGKSTLQLYATMPFRLRVGMLIAQVSFWVPTGEITLYNGKYQNSQGPRPSLTHLDVHEV